MAASNLETEFAKLDLTDGDEGGLSSEDGSGSGSSPELGSDDSLSPDLSAEGSFELLPVIAVNWADVTINRTSIIPISRSSGHRWVGLGVNRYGSTISSIGGVYEPEDHDLLATAVREWTEEIGSNRRPLVAANLYPWQAIKSKSFINILLPTQRSLDFQPTEEIEFILWVTPAQLQAMQANQLVFLGRGRGQYNERVGATNKGTRAFIFTKELAFSIDAIVASLQTEVIFQPVSPQPFDRPRKQNIKLEPKVVTSMAGFLAEINPKWYSQAFILTDEHVIIYRRNRIVYQLPRADLPQIMAALTRNEVKIMVPFEEDLLPLRGTALRAQNTLVARRQLERAGFGSLIPKFEAEIAAARSLPPAERVEEEVGLIYRYEYLAYKQIEKKGTAFRYQRNCFLSLLNIINFMLADQKVPIRYVDLVRMLRTGHRSLQTCPKYMLSIDQTDSLNLHSVLDLLIRTGTLLQNPHTTVITIP